MSDKCIEFLVLRRTLKLCTLNANFHNCAVAATSHFEFRSKTKHQMHRVDCSTTQSLTAGTAQGTGFRGQRDCGRPLTIRLRVVSPRLRVRDGSLARELLLEVSAETGREAIGRHIPKAGGHAHRAGAKGG